jgi:spore coat polysaccharide biosynthesis protein SpsF (cytidylyltransferase family)
LFSLAEELLAKESIGLPDIIRILGDRPFPMKENVKEYLQEMLDRKEKDDAAAAETPASNLDAQTPVGDAK